MALTRSRGQYVGQAVVTAQNLAQVLEHNISGTIGKAQVAIDALAREMERQLAAGGIQEASLGRYLARAEPAAPELDGLRVVDARGHLLNAPAAAAGARINVADREYFQLLRDHPETRVVVSKPLKGRISGRWIINLAQRIEGPDGRFAGVAFGTLPLTGIDRLFSSIQVGPHGAFTLRDGGDLALVARYPELQGIGSAVGNRILTRQLTDLLDRGITRGAYDATSWADHRVRTWGYRRFANGLFYIFVGLAPDDYLAEWRRLRDSFAVFLGCFLLGSSLAGAGWFRAWQRHRAARAALRTNDERLRLFFERQIVGMAICSAEGRWLQLNDKWCEIMGHPREELVGAPWEAFTHPQDRDRALQLFEQLSRGERDQFTLTQRCLRPDGSLVMVDQSVGCVRNPDGSLNWVLAVMEDVTERNRMQQQLHTAEKLESLGRLAGGVAHDMNNVLGAILGMASAHLELQPEESAARRAFEIIAKAATRGGQMVKRLLVLARQTPAEAQELDLNGLLREEVQLLERTTLAKVRLELDLAGDLGLVRGDPAALTHAFMNLCVNAVDAMETGGTLTIRTRMLNPRWVEVRIEDDGCGMSAEVLERALDPFFTTKGSGRGTGLGLSIVHSTVKAHQGELELQSQPGRGTQVSLRFPVLRPLAPAPGPVAGAADLAAASALRVLVVDDDELIRGSTREVLDVLGHQVSTATSGEEALAALEAGLQVDVVVLDLNMPGLGGAGTLPRLRGLSPTLPVLLCTGRADQDALNLAALFPRVTLLAKPFSIADLQQRLQLCRQEGRRLFPDGAGFSARL